MEMNKKQILKSFLENLDRISNKEYQKRIWIEGRAPECDDFDEPVCNFFQDGNGIMEMAKEVLTAFHYPKKNP